MKTSQCIAGRIFGLEGVGNNAFQTIKDRWAECSRQAGG
jgi:hypothetical protein